jgi:rhodanese-related sulfurtransferase
MLLRRLSVLTLPAVLLVFGLTGTGSTSQVRQLTVQEVKAAMDKAPSLREKGFVLVDVRTVEEHDRGAIPGTDLNIDYRQIGQRHRELGVAPEDHIVVYCQSGKRSNIAADTLSELGYKNVYNIRGSMNAWLQAGYPVASGKR